MSNVQVGPALEIPAIKSMANSEPQARAILGNWTFFIGNWTFLIGHSPPYSLQPIGTANTGIWE